MYVEPNTQIRILKDVPLDPSYDHTIFFTDLASQMSYFVSMTKYVLGRQSYQRVQRGWMRINIQAEMLYDCNYVMFQNSAFGTKWFYAFLKSVEYINDNVSQIEFEIDPMQTWFFDYELEQCFVEREHSETDELFENIIPENLNLGDEYVSNGIDHFDMNTQALCILINQKTRQGYAEATIINNVYSPMHVIVYPRLDDPLALSDIKQLLDPYVEDDIICIYQFPSFLGDASTHTPVTAGKIVAPNLTFIDGYRPKNKKLFSYPYNFLLVSNNCGQSAEYRWEDWSSDASRGQFTITGVFLTTPAVLCYPANYRNMAADYDSGLMYSNFPQCAWGGDTFKAWWAQNKNSFIVGGVTSILSSMVGTASGSTNAMLENTGNIDKANIGVTKSVVGGVLDTASVVAKSVAKIEDIKNMPNQMHGQVQTDCLNPGMGRQEYTFYRMTIKAQHAKIIDDYFERYGYATKRNKIPNRNVRPHWTFTKTKGCTIKGSIPADDAVAICRIYDNGITFWRSGPEVGDYSLDNSPVTP